MQVVSWVQESGSLDGQREGAVLLSPLVPGTSDISRVSIISNLSTKQHLAFIICAVLAALFFVLKFYSCLLRTTRQNPQNPVIRRLASSGEDDDCQDLLASATAAPSNPPDEGLQRLQSPSVSTSDTREDTRKRKHPNYHTQGDGSEDAKKLLLEDVTESPTTTSQDQSVSSSHLFWEGGRVQLQTPHASGEAAPSAAFKSTTEAAGTQDFGNIASLIRVYLQDGAAFDERFLDDVLGGFPSTSTPSSPTVKLPLPEDNWIETDSDDGSDEDDIPSSSGVAISTSIQHQLSAGKLLQRVSAPHGPGHPLPYGPETSEAPQASQSWSHASTVGMSHQQQQLHGLLDSSGFAASTAMGYQQHMPLGFPVSAESFPFVHGGYEQQAPYSAPGSAPVDGVGHGQQPLYGMPGAPAVPGLFGNMGYMQQPGYGWPTASNMAPVSNMGYQQPMPYGVPIVPQSFPADAMGYQQQIPYGVLPASHSAPLGMTNMDQLLHGLLGGPESAPASVMGYNEEAFSGLLATSKSAPVGDMGYYQQSSLTLPTASESVPAEGVVAQQQLSYAVVGASGPAPLDGTVPRQEPSYSLPTASESAPAEGIVQQQRPSCSLPAASGAAPEDDTGSHQEPPGNSPTASESASSDDTGPEKSPHHISLTAMEADPDDDVRLLEHPFYKLPPTVEWSPATPFDWEGAINHAPRKRLSDILREVRVLMLKKEMDETDLWDLRRLACELIRSAATLGKFERASLRTCHVQESVARRFLIADSLWSICYVVGPAMEIEKWWKLEMDKLLALPEFTQSMRTTRNSRHPFVTSLISALEMYRKGKRPSARIVVELKQEIFCRSNSPLAFRKAEFDTWRYDHNMWLLTRTK